MQKWFDFIDQASCLFDLDIKSKTYFKKKSVHSNFAMKKTFKRIAHSLNANIYRFHFEKKHYADNQYIINTGNCRPRKRLKLNSQLPLKL